jgi:hypothetical protein
MAEAMTAESIVEAEWVLNGYWAKMRFAFQTDKGAWSDVDILAYNPETKHLVISESKVRGSKDNVFAYTKYTEQEYGSILKYDDDNYFSFLRHLPLLCKDGVIFKDFKKMVEKLTVQLVSNYVVTADTKKSAIASIEKKIQKYNLPIKIVFQLDTTLTVIARVIAGEKKSRQGRRYGHPMLDIAREINRYFYPSVRYAGRTSAASTKVRQEAIEEFVKSLGL